MYIYMYKLFQLNLSPNSSLISLLRELLRSSTIYLFVELEAAKKHVVNFLPREICSSSIGLHGPTPGRKSDPLGPVLGHRMINQKCSTT